MRTIGYFLLFIIPALYSKAEELKVYSCESKLIKLPEYTIDVATENGDIPRINTYKIKKELGTINTGESPFSKIAESAFSYDSSMDPFFGPGYLYIIRDSSDRHYVVFFEYEPGHKTFTGFRLGIGLLNDLGSNKAVFVGNPYNGKSFDENILKQLKTITEKK